ncbi:MAG: GTPase HflX [Candidatus Omnitrophota bacterium]
MERALLITIRFKTERDEWPMKDSVEELEELAATSGAEVIDHISYTGEKPTPNFFIGSGKAKELAALCQEEDIGTVIFGRNLSGTQQRNLEEVIGKKTIDRTQLILDIFAKHAKTPEGKMQVELAQLEYLMPRLVGKGIILSRLGGGIGTRGPGEQKLEVDRRRTRKRIDKLKDDLKSVAQHRQTLKKRRKENAVASIALVGYTNAGKSTLLNSLTEAGQIVADSLFTTLDPLSKALVLPDGEHVIVSDTVGFLHGLPHGLIEAFKATLEEVLDADLLIHVLDVSHPRVYEHSQAVLTVLKELQAEQKPTITALNKIDLLDDKMWLARLESDFPNSVSISAKLKENLGLLLDKVQENFKERVQKITLLLPNSRMDLVDLFYRQAKVVEVKYLQKGIKIKLILPKPLLHNILHDKEIEIVS